MFQGNVFPIIQKPSINLFISDAIRSRGYVSLISISNQNLFNVVSDYQLKKTGGTY